MKLEIATSIVEWFDPTNLSHLRAYDKLQRTGTWPVGFLPENILFPMAWLSSIAFKITELYVSDILERNERQRTCPYRGTAGQCNSPWEVTS